MKTIILFMALIFFTTNAKASMRSDNYQLSNNTTSVVNSVSTSANYIHKVNMTQKIINMDSNTYSFRNISIKNVPREYTILDALKALQLTSDNNQPAPEQLAIYDIAPIVNGKSAPNGIIDVGDAIIILKIVVGLIHL